MDVEHVREFVSVVDEGGFTRAAAACHTTQPAVSRHMAELERELGAQLLVRGKQTLPTEDGRLFYEDALRLLQDWDLALARLKAFRRAPQTSLAVRAFVGYKLTDDLLDMLPNAFRKAGMRLELKVEDIVDESPFEALREGRADLVLAPMPEGQDYAGLARAPLFQDEVVAIVDEGHPLAKSDRIRMADLGSSLVWTFDDGERGGFYKEIERKLVRNGATPVFSPYPWSNTRHLYGTLPFASGGVHINLLNAVRYSMPSTLGGKKVLRFSDADAADMGYVAWREGTANPAVPAAVGILTEEARRLGEGVAPGGEEGARPQ